MITSTNRFHGYGSLRYVYRNGQVVRGPICAINYAPNDRRQHYRLAVVVSKKVNKSAVVRNRIRRRFYETMRHQAKNITRPYDMVFTIFNDQAEQLTPKELTRLVRAQLKQAGILDKASTQS